TRAVSLPDASRASDRKDSTPRWRTRPIALRDFEGAYVSSGSLATGEVEATLSSMSALPPKADMAGRFMSTRPENVRRTYYADILRTARVGVGSFRALNS